MQSIPRSTNTVDHQILISKLEHHEICGILLSWFKNYLINKCNIKKTKKYCQINQIFRFTARLT